MSRVIKSSNVNQLDSEKKTIGLKKVISEQQIEEIEVAATEEIVEDPMIQIEELRNHALAEAEQIKRNAELEYEQFHMRMNDELIFHQQQAEELFRQAEENGYNAGFQQGLEEGKKQYESFIEEAKEVVAASRIDYFQRIEEAEPTILQLALTVAEKVIGDSLQLDSENWIAIVKDVINEVREQDQVKLYVHPNWYETTLTHKDELRALLPNCETLYIYPDLHLDENGCTIETPYGKIDASVNSQLTEIKYALLEKLKELGGHESS